LHRSTEARLKSEYPTQANPVVRVADSQSRTMKPYIPPTEPRSPTNGGAGAGAKLWVTGGALILLLAASITILLASNGDEGDQADGASPGTAIADVTAPDVMLSETPTLAPPDATAPALAAQATETTVETATVAPSVVMVTPEEAATSTPTQTASPSGSPPGDVREVVAFDFIEGEPLEQWRLGADGENYAMLLQNGHFVVNVSSANPPGFDALQYARGSPSVRNGSITVRVRIEGDGYAGVVFRGTSTVGDRINQFYECSYTEDGRFSCRKYVDERWMPVDDMTVPIPSDAIRGTDYNDITVSARGNQFTFDINGTTVATWTDDTYESGVWGVFAGHPPASPGVQAYFDTVQVFSTE
ncbi:MAG: hypothetical protein M3173_00105, partial [Chloroflexota bacterium]|nr:hypothetical protein [Chloroflexota bacterium]